MALGKACLAGPEGAAEVQTTETGGMIGMVAVRLQSVKRVLYCLSGDST